MAIFLNHNWSSTAKQAIQQTRAPWITPVTK